MKRGLDPDTVRTIRKMKEKGTSFRSLAQDLGYAPQPMAATLSMVFRDMNGAMSLYMENDLRSRLGLPALPETQTVIVCPTCGDPAHGLPHDCHGQHVAIVPPGHVVKPAPKPRSKPARRRHRLDITRLIEAGISRDEIAAHLEALAAKSGKVEIG